jgi:ABC-2 type transport system ATP-binding protein
MDYAVETISLTKVFSDWWGRTKVYAVDDLSLQIRHNEVFGLLGPNGSGKTTALKMLLGLLYPTKGRTIVLGGDGADSKINARIGYLPEESYLYRFLNARETLDFYGRLFGLPAKVRRMRIEALLDMVGLKAVAGRPVGTYSKGMARRIGLAQALINDPDLLILDEPTSGLDPIGTRQIKDLILKLAERGKTVLLSSHLLADVEDVCDRIAILYGGRIQALGNVRELLQQTNKRQIITDALSDEAVERIRQILQQEHAGFDITSPMEKLETFFVRTVLEAQQQDRPTSGAVSTTQIGDFLAPQAHGQEVLEKLVSSQVSPENPLQPVSASTEAGAAAESAGPAPDEQLLEKLTKTPTQSETERLTEGRSEKTEPVESQLSADAGQDETRKNILDRLTGRSTTDNEKTGHNGKQTPEESGNG